MGDPAVAQNIIIFMVISRLFGSVASTVVVFDTCMKLFLSDSAQPVVAV